MLLLLLLFVADRQNQEREIDTAADTRYRGNESKMMNAFLKAGSVWWRASSLVHSSKLFLTTERREYVRKIVNNLVAGDSCILSDYRWTDVSQKEY